MDLKQVARFNWFPLEVWISIWLFSYTQGKNIVHAWDIIYPSKIGDLGDFRPSEHGFWFQKLGPVIRNLRSHIPISLAVECVKVFFSQQPIERSAMDSVMATAITVRRWSNCPTESGAAKVPSEKKHMAPWTKKVCVYFSGQKRKTKKSFAIVRTKNMHQDSWGSSTNPGASLVTLRFSIKTSWN